MDHQAMVRYLAGELRLPAAEVDRTLRTFEEYLEARQEHDSVELDAAVKWIVERTMLPWRQVEQTITAMLGLSAKLDEAIGSGEASTRKRQPGFPLTPDHGGGLNWRGP
jgi:hypothetical protein